MMQIALGASVAKELLGLLGSVIESPDTYKRLDGLRSIVGKVTGKEIDKGAFLAMLEMSTQGEPYTGKWEAIDPDTVGSGSRLRVEGGYIYDRNRGNPIFVADK